MAVGKPGLVTGDMITPGAALIDIGINQITDKDGNSTVVGDAEFVSCLESAGWITPVPGGGRTGYCGGFDAQFCDSGGPD